MAAPTVAQAPSALVTAIPGRFAPTRIVDRRNPTAIVADTATTSRNVFMPRAESLSVDFQTPTQTVEELGTSYHVGEYDQLPEVKVTLNNYDVGCGALSLITGKQILGTGTTTFAPTDLSTAEVDLVMQFADPNGKIFYSEYCGDLVVDGYGSTLKKGSAAMENFSMAGFNQLGFRGQFVTKAYIVQAADVTGNSFQLAAATNPVIGTDEAPVGLPVPSGSQPPSYWIQRGSLNFVKIERYRAATGWFRFKETSGAVSAGVCKYTGGANMTLTFNAGDLTAGDLFFVTYATYKSDVTNYSTIPTTTLDTSDAIAVDTRLCNINVTAQAQASSQVSRGQQFDLKVDLKRERAEGIGDTDGLWAPPAQPNVSLSMDVDLTGASVDSLLKTGISTGTDGAGTVTGDWVDPNYTTRVMLNSPTTVGVTVNDPRNAGAVLKTITSSNAVFKQRTVSAQTKNSVTLKYSGSDTVGNVAVSVTH